MVDWPIAVLVLVLFSWVAKLVSVRFGIQFWFFPALVGVFFIVGLVLYHPGSPIRLPSDGDYYYGWGMELSSWLSGEVYQGPERSIWPGKGLWPLLIGLSNSLLGAEHASLVAMNAVILGFSFQAMQKTTALLGGGDSEFSLAALLLTSPAVMVFGPSLLRESFVWLGFSLVVLGLAFAALRRLLPGVMALLVAVFVQIGFRPDFGLVTAFAAIAVFGAVLFLGGNRRVLWRGGSLLVLYFVLASSFLPLLRYLTQQDSGSVVGGDALVRNVRRALGNSDQQLAFQLSEGGEETPFTAIAHSLFGPFPSEISNAPVTWIAGLSTIHFYVVLLPALFVPLIQRRFVWVVLGVVALTLLQLAVFSYLFRNYGIVMRFRGGTEFLLLPLASFVLNSFVSKTWPRKSG